MVYERMLAEYQRLEAEILSVKKQISALPEGNLTCARNGNYYKWYHSDGHKQTYIPKEEQSLAEQLAKKKYLVLVLKELQNEKIAIESYLKYH